jgi:hypothetical protein
MAACNQIARFKVHPCPLPEKIIRHGHLALHWHA